MLSHVPAYRQPIVCSCACVLVKGYKGETYEVLIRSVPVNIVDYEREIKKEGCPLSSSQQKETNEQMDAIFW